MRSQARLGRTGMKEKCIQDKFRWIIGGSLEMSNGDVGGVKHIPEFLHWIIGNRVAI